MRLRAMLFAVAVMLLAMLPNFWMRDAFPPHDTGELFASVVLSMMYGLAVGSLAAWFLLRRLMR